MYRHYKQRQRTTKSSGERRRGATERDSSVDIPLSLLRASKDAAYLLEQPYNRPVAARKLVFRPEGNPELADGG
jgi:hypothetical protein